MPDEPTTQVRVFFGRRFRTESLSKVDAARTEPYSVYFSVKGHFKRLSVVHERTRRGKELSREITAENAHGEVDTGGPVGREVW